MKIFAALIYWVIITLWLSVLATVCIAYLRNSPRFGSTRLVLGVVAIDTVRNIVENVYFGLHFGSEYGLFHAKIAETLGAPEFLILPKIVNVLAACLVMGVLLLRWLPAATREWDTAQRGLHDAEQHFKLLVDSVKEYAICPLDTNGHITSWNSGAERIMGYSTAEAIGIHFEKFYREEDQRAGLAQEALAIARRTGHFEVKAWRVRKDGSQFWANVVIEPMRDSALVGFVMIVKDITEDRRHEERLYQLAHFDQLTGLPNRTSLSEMLTEASRQKEPPALSTGIVVLGLDDLKSTNDTFGQTVGDRVLIAAAARLRSVLRAPCSLYRVDKDEFAVVVAGGQAEFTLAEHARRALKALEAPFELDGRRIFIRASAGITVADGSQTTEEVIANGNLARAAARAQGGARYQAFVPAMRAEAQVRQLINVELRRAFENEEFVVYYQPQIRLRDGALVGCEALLRWNHPNRGLIQPGEFIEALARSPVATDVGNWVLDTACRTAATWQRRHEEPIRIGVNLFPDQFRDPDLVDRVRSAIEAHGLPPGALELEIMENIAIVRDGETPAKLQALRALGVGLAVDDFGTGFASLSHLTQLPLTRVKIDRSFVEMIGDSPTASDTAMVRSIISMAENFGLDVIAEGIETLQQAVYLHGRNCSEGQGYLYARPLSLSDLEEYIGGSRARRLAAGA